MIYFKEIHIAEIAEHFNQCYIESMQTVYQILKYLFHKEDSLITILSIHFLNKQPVYFLKNATVKEIQQITNQFSSTFMIFFNYCAGNSDAQQYLYHKFPVHFVYD